MKHVTWWWLSAVLSLLLIGVLVILWMGMNQYDPMARKDPKVSHGPEGHFDTLGSHNPEQCHDPDRGLHLPCSSPQLDNARATTEFLESKWEFREQDGDGIEPTIYVKTGIFIQSLKFFNSTEVNMNGFI